MVRGTRAGLRVGSTAVGAAWTGAWGSRPRGPAGHGPRCPPAVRGAVPLWPTALRPPGPERGRQSSGRRGRGRGAAARGAPPATGPGVCRPCGGPFHCGRRHSGRRVPSGAGSRRGGVDGGVGAAARGAPPATGPGVRRPCGGRSTVADGTPAAGFRAGPAVVGRRGPGRGVVARGAWRLRVRVSARLFRCRSAVADGTPALRPPGSERGRQLSGRRGPESGAWGA